MLGLEQMQKMQIALQEKYKDKWGGLYPEKAKQMLLWMIAEAGEAAQVIKHRGNDRILTEPESRRHFAEEMCDVLMYLNDVLLCYGITPEEIEAIYREKHETNMKRW